MSLLLQALQRAAKSREVTGQEPDAGAAPRLELEPQAAPVPAESSAGFDLDEAPPEAPARRVAAPPQSYLAATEYGNPTLVDYVRERPVVAFGAFALLFAVCYGIYLYLQIFHPQWLRGDFGQSTGITAGNPPPPPTATATNALNVPSTDSAFGTSATPAYPSTSYPATSYPPTSPATGNNMGAASPGALPAPTPLPGFAPQSPAPAAAGQSGATDPHNAELASLMNLPARQAAQAPAAAPSRLSTLSNALGEAPQVEPARPTPPAPRLTEAPATPRSLPAVAAPARTPPATVQPAPRPRNTPTTRPAMAGAKPLGAGQPQSDGGLIELKDQVVINAAPAQQIEAVTVADAYRAWRAGRLDQAREIYRDVLSNEPKNVDALLGLAGIAQQQGNAQEALTYFGRALELDPRNSSAQAGIIAMTGQSDPAASEARLKQLIAREPSGFLHFTLGNLHARQGQWAQAQQSYFQAYGMNGDNADYAYNLAVSLEHIGQDKLAVTYYRKAVDLSLKQGGRASFNQEQVIDRIAKLSLRAR